MTSPPAGDIKAALSPVQLRRQQRDTTEKDHTPISLLGDAVSPHFFSACLLFSTSVVSFLSGSNTHLCTSPHFLVSVPLRLLQPPFTNSILQLCSTFFIQCVRASVMAMITFSGHHSITHCNVAV